MTNTKWQNPFRRKALRAIPRVVDNTDLLAIKQHAMNEAHHPVRRGAKRGVFNPVGNKKYV